MLCAGLTLELESPLEHALSFEVTDIQLRISVGDIERL